jgi:hypothetical protein
MPPDVLETDVKLMDLYTVHDRDVEATITSDGDSLTVTGTDLTDVTASIISSHSDVGSVTFHSVISKHRMHTNTRYSMVGDRGEFDMRLYGKPCRAAALTRFRNLEIFRVSNRSVSFIVSVYILHESIPKFPCFLEDWITILCCALNVARMQPHLFAYYRNLSRKRQGRYGEAVAAMLPFECLRGTNQKKAQMKDTVTDIPHATGSDYISVFWEVIQCWARLPEELDPDQMDTLMEKYNLAPMLGGSVNHARTTLSVLPMFARYMTKDAIFSARAVGTKSAWQSKPCSVVMMNDKEGLWNAFDAHSVVIEKQFRKILTPVTEPRRELVIGGDIGHHIAPTTDHTSFLCHGYGMASFAKDATTRTKHHEKIWREDATNSAGKLASAVSCLLILPECVSRFHFLFPDVTDVDCSSGWEILSHCPADAALPLEHPDVFEGILSLQHTQQTDDGGTVASDTEESDFDAALDGADIQDLIDGNTDGSNRRQPGESLVDQEAGQNAQAGTHHLLTDDNEADITNDNLLELVSQGRLSARNIFPLHGTAGLLANVHTSKVVLQVGTTMNELGDGERLKIRLKQDMKCIHGLQAYNTSTKNDLKKPSRPSLDLEVKKLASLVSFYFTPYKTQAETDRIPEVLAVIRATLRLLSEALEEQTHMARQCHRRPLRLEIFYNETAEDFFDVEKGLLFPYTSVSIAEGIVQVAQAQVLTFHIRVNEQVIDPLVTTFMTSDADDPPNPDTLNAGEKTYLAYAAEALSVFYGCFPPSTGPIFSTLISHGWKLPDTFQPQPLFRLQGREDTYKWTKIPFGLKACIRPCTFDTGRGLDQIHSGELHRKELNKLRQDIAVHMKGIVRIPYEYAKTKATILGLFYRFGSLRPSVTSNGDSSMSDSDEVDTPDDSVDDTPGLFDDINFVVLAGLNDTSRREFLESAINSILELYSEEWRNILDGKLVHYRQESPSGRNPRRARNTPRRDCVLPSTISMPWTWSEVSSMLSTHDDSSHVVSASFGAAITTSAGKFVAVRR